MIQTIIDFVLHIDQHLIWLTENYGLWIYVILFMIILCETGLVVTPILPGDSLLFSAGGLAAIGSLNIYVMIVALIIAAILGDGMNYFIGKHFGRRLFSNPHSRIFKQSYLDKTHAFYDKYGGKTIVIARFAPIVRTFAPFVAGIGHMKYSYFLKYNIIGAVLWISIFLLAGYWFANIPFVKDNLSLVIMGIIVLSIVPIIIEFIKHRKTES